MSSRYSLIVKPLDSFSWNACLLRDAPADFPVRGFSLNIGIGHSGMSANVNTGASESLGCGCFCRTSCGRTTGCAWGLKVIRCSKLFINLSCKLRSLAISVVSIISAYWPSTLPNTSLIRPGSLKAVYDQSSSVSHLTQSSRMTFPSQREFKSFLM